MWKWAAGLLGGVVLAFAAWGFWSTYGAFFLPGGLTGECGYDVLERATSPDGRVDAHVVRVNCGATTAYSIKIVLTQAGHAFDEKGAVTVAGFDWDEAKASWNQDGLLITIDDRAKPFREEPEGMGVSVRYRTVHAAEAPKDSADEAWLRRQEAKQGVDLH